MSHEVTTQSAQKEKERNAFKSFLQAHPSLANQLSSWNVQEDEGAFPDIIAKTRDSHELGFELGEWLHEEQVRQGKRMTQFDLDILRAVGQQPNNTSQHIHSVLLIPKSDCLQFDKRDHKLRAELFDLIQETNQRWPNERHWQDAQGYHCTEFDRFPTLAKYFSRVWFTPRVLGEIQKKPFSPGIPWINVEGRGGSSSGESARNAIQAIISKKAGHYGPSQRVSLLIHYGADAFSHNTPFMDMATPDFEATARFAHEVVRSLDRLPFEKVYLCNTLPFELEAYEIFPQLLKCG